MLTPPESRAVPARLLLLRADDHLAGLALTDAFSNDIGVVGQSQMNNAPLISRHRLQGKGGAFSLDPFRHLLGKRLQGLVAALLVTFHINDNGHPGLNLLPNQKPDNILQSGQSLSPPPDKNAQVIALDIEGYRRGGTCFLSHRWRSLRLNGGGHSEQLEQLLDDISGDRRRITPGLGYRRHPDDGLLSPNAQNTGLTFSYNVDFYLVPVYA